MIHSPYLCAYFPLMRDTLDHSGMGVTATPHSVSVGPGRIGDAHVFAPASYIDIGAAQRAITVAMWAKFSPPSPGAWAYAFDHRPGYGAYITNFGFGGGWTDCYLNGAPIAKGVELPDNQWVHLCAIAEWHLTEPSRLGNRFEFSSPEGGYGAFQHLAYFSERLSASDVRRVMLGFAPVSAAPR